MVGGGSGAKDFQAFQNLFGKVVLHHPLQPWGESATGSALFEEQAGGSAPDSGSHPRLQPHPAANGKASCPNFAKDERPAFEERGDSNASLGPRTLPGLEGTKSEEKSRRRRYSREMIFSIIDAPGKEIPVSSSTLSSLTGVRGNSLSPAGAALGCGKCLLLIESTRSGQRTPESHAFPTLVPHAFDREAVNGNELVNKGASDSNTSVSTLASDPPLKCDDREPSKCSRECQIATPGCGSRMHYSREVVMALRPSHSGCPPGLADQPFRRLRSPPAVSAGCNIALESRQHPGLEGTKSEEKSRRRRYSREMIFSIRDAPGKDIPASSSTLSSLTGVRGYSLSPAGAALGCGKCLLLIESNRSGQRAPESHALPTLVPHAFDREAVNGNELVNKGASDANTSVSTLASDPPLKCDGKGPSKCSRECQIATPGCRSRMHYSREVVMALKPRHSGCPAGLVGQPFRRLRNASTGSAGCNFIGAGTSVEINSVLDACGIPRSRDVLLSGADVHTTFKELCLSSSVWEGLERAGFYRPSPVQVRGIPLGRLGVDIIAQAKSGTGKTLVFCVIALEAYLSMQCGSRGIGAIILAPTRDIAVQIRDVLVTVGAAIEPKVNVGVYIGGTSVKADEDELRMHAPSIAVGTPGRVEDLVERGIMDVSMVKLLVMDEADRLLDASFGGSVRTICSMFPQAKQVMTFSATYSLSLLRILQEVMRSPQYINLCGNDSRELSGSRDKNVSETVNPNFSESPLSESDLDTRHIAKDEETQLDRVDANRGAVLRSVRQFAVDLGMPMAADRQRHRDSTSVLKIDTVVEILSRHPFGQAVVFLNDKCGGRIVCSDLCKKGFGAVYTSGSEPQSTRMASLEAMRKGKARVLVATDLIARGVDLPGCDLVIHLDVPNNSATYLHRVGRAGRFGSRGMSLILYFSGPEGNAVNYLERCLELQFENGVGPLSLSKPCAEASMTSVEPREGKIAESLVDDSCAVGAVVPSSGCAKDMIDRDDLPEQVAEDEMAIASVSLEGESHNIDGLRASGDPGKRSVPSGYKTIYDNRDGSGFSQSVDLPDVRFADPGNIANGPAQNGRRKVAGEGQGDAAGRGLPDGFQEQAGDETADIYWERYAQQAFEAGHQAGFEMARRMAADISSRLGPGGLLAFIKKG